MASPYTSVDLSGYNDDAPTDDGSNVANNALKWSNHINKIGNPLKTLAEGIDTNVQAAFTNVFNKVAQSDDGTDYNTVFDGMVDWSISGLSGKIKLDGISFDTVKANDNFIIEGAAASRAVLRSIHLRLEPGTTPGTHVNVMDRSDVSGRGYNPPDITDAVDLEKSTTVGSFIMDSVGKIDVDLSETVLGVLSSSIQGHDLNGSSTTEMYTLNVAIVTGNIQIALVKRGGSVVQDWTAILDAGDLCDIQVCFITSS